MSSVIVKIFNLDKLYTICNLSNSCNNVVNKCNNKLNKDDDVTNYIKTKSVLKNLCNICICLYISNIENDLNQKIIGVPPIYKDFIEVFNERNCNILSPHREYDCEIKLKDNSNLFYGPIYPLTEAERDELKKYIKENLEKGFIRKSKLPSGASVLFVKKKVSLFHQHNDTKWVNKQ